MTTCCFDNCTNTQYNSNTVLTLDGQQPVCKKHYFIEELFTHSPPVASIILLCIWLFFATNTFFIPALAFIVLSLGYYRRTDLHPQIPPKQ